ncbi:MAG: LysM peptidoglycan-binding domain-containing protein, partial [Desulfobulbus sp.]|nr:LysM peptidoglycan-binding domain-containing protein [Desulfobulbus sp.]
MKTLTPLLTHCLLLFLALFFSACSSHSPAPVDSYRSYSKTYISEDVEEEDVEPAEPEETALEELEALNQPGMWEYGANQSYSPEKFGIDPSKYDFPITINKQVLYYLELFQGKQRNYFSQWLARSTIYRPYIESELKKAGLPLDLVYLAMIESGFNPSAYSPANACGLWQFIAGTGTRYGLRIDSWVDERREPEKATKAAARYLSNLYNQFGDWHLAVAAYNAGEGKIDSAMKTYNAKDFWEVAVSDGIFMETKRYVPKLIAAIIIARNPEHYGFKNTQYMKPGQYEVISVPGGSSLDAVASIANTSVKTLRSLNNELRKNQTPPHQKYALRIPVGTKGLIAANIDKLRPVTTTVFITHVVKKNETLTSICKKYNTNKTALLKANNLRSARLPQGLRLRIPSTSTKYLIAQKDQQPVGRIAIADKKSKQPQQAATTYTLKSGDTLASVAKKHQIPLKNLLALNKLEAKSIVRQGQQITLRSASSPQKTTGSPAVTHKNTAVAKLATNIRASAQKSVSQPVRTPSLAKMQPQPAAKPVASASKKAPATWYVVKQGDTLSGIAKKFQTSPQDLRSWNKLS